MRGGKEKYLIIIIINNHHKILSLATNVSFVCNIFMFNLIFTNLWRWEETTTRILQFYEINIKF